MASVCSSRGRSAATAAPVRPATVRRPAQGVASFADQHAIAEFEKTNAFFSSPALRRFALEKADAPDMPAGHTASEKRGRRFFENRPPDPTDGFKPGLCAHCHSGPLLNQ